ncbi:SpoIIE family protein phosphatase [Micromonospora sp. NPDC007230]|uniref:SpoIIE family protein phosphatase n=1 Tax=Micromonospora sp. NPDC007230 TaxID=3364237 RepID=UPI0036CFEC43
MILSRLNTLLRRTGNATTATAVIATYQPSSSLLVWANAGHPPPLLAVGQRVERLPNPGAH